jgi:hypothetical protein
MAGVRFFWGLGPANGRNRDGALTEAQSHGENLLWLWQFSAVQREMRKGEGAREWTRIHANGRKWDFALRRGGGGRNWRGEGACEWKTRVGSDRRADPRFRRAAPPGGKKDSHRGAGARRGGTGK